MPPTSEFILLTWHCWEGVHELCDKAECMCPCHEDTTEEVPPSEQGD